MSADRVRVGVADGIATLELARPDSGNAIDPAMTAALRAGADALAARDDVRVVVLRGQGPTFCVGGDLRFMHEAGAQAGELVHRLAGDFHAAIQTLMGLDAPVIAAVRGGVAGGALGLVLSADLVVAAASSRFTMSYTAVGLSPDGGTTWLLPRIVGHRRAAELALTNRRLDAAEAAELGIVTRVVADADLDAEVAQLARRLAAGPTGAYAEVKRLLGLAPTRTLSEHLADEAATIGRMAGGPAAREGIAAFLAKRPPDFSAA
jgi:2-(1,2-epoxy-1,2-dihydrophenyl)acetyl-CoA isomerase